MSIPTNKLFKLAFRQSHDIPGLNRFKWSTTFFVQALDLTAARAIAQTTWVDYLRVACTTSVFGYEVYVSDTIEGTSLYSVDPIPPGQQRGTFPNPQGDPEPYLGKACVTVTIPVVGSRPSRKFWRPGLREGHVVDGQTLESVIADRIRTNFDLMLADLDLGLCDPDGEPLATGVRLRLTTRELGRYASADLPAAPPQG